MGFARGLAITDTLEEGWAFKSQTICKTLIAKQKRFLLGILNAGILLNYATFDFEAGTPSQRQSNFLHDHILFNQLSWSEVRSDSSALFTRFTPFCHNASCWQTRRASRSENYHLPTKWLNHFQTVKHIQKCTTPVLTMGINRDMNTTKIGTTQA
uniref:Uncharacterized protein n=1 Tax=Romanomermis culicivorax TaxID=13658 RepID=A0A915KLS2_ROMCU